MQHLKENLGVEVCDEISQVGSYLFHATALRTTCCPKDLHLLRSEDYTRFMGTLCSVHRLWRFSSAAAGAGHSFVVVPKVVKLL